MRQHRLVVEGLSFYYGAVRALYRVSFKVGAGELAVVMGPTGSGKTTLLRCVNRLCDLHGRTRREGRILLDGRDIYAAGTCPTTLRRRVGMVFAVPTPLPLSVYDNVAYGPRLAGRGRRQELDALVEESLRAAALWDEVAGRLREPAFRLSGGQQQRLAIARVLAMRPEVILLDEPTSGLDPVSTLRIEELLRGLAGSYTIVLVTNNPRQAARLGAKVLFLYLGHLVEQGPARQVFSNPRDPRTQDFISGRVG